MSNSRPFDAQPESPAHVAPCKSQCRRLRLGLKRPRIRHRNHLQFFPLNDVGSAISGISAYRPQNRFARGRIWPCVRIVWSTCFFDRFSGNSEAMTGLSSTMAKICNALTFFCGKAAIYCCLPARRDSVGWDCSGQMAPSYRAAGHQQATLSRGTRSFGRSTAQSRTDVEERADMHNGKYKHRSRAETVSIQRNRTPNYRVRRRI